MRLFFFFCLLTFFFQDSFAQKKLLVATVNRHSQTDLNNKDSVAYSHNAQGKSISKVTFKMNKSTKKWENYSMSLYLESEDFDRVEMFYLWDKDWKKIEKSQTTVSKNPNTTLVERFAWNNHTNDWMKSSKSIIVNDSAAHINLSQDWRYFAGTNK